MKWTSEKPKEAGWYWMRADISGEGIEGVRYCEKVVCLWETAVGLFVGNHGYLQDVEGGEWYGPISPTDRQQGRVAGLKQGIEKLREREKFYTEQEAISEGQMRLTRGLQRNESSCCIHELEKLAQQAQDEKGVGDGN